jgi:hypothetical protein
MNSVPQMSARNHPDAGEMSEDEAQFLAFLEHLRTQDPELYAQTMMSMQQQAANAVAQQQSPGGNVDSANAAGGENMLGNMTGMLEALKAARASGGAAGINPGAFDGLNMPGLNKMMGKDGVEDKKPGIMITPTAGFVIKTKDMTSDQKIMINVCTHEEIDKPSLKKKLDENGEPVEGMNIPLSAGPSRQDTDKSGVSCVVYDVIVNPEVVKESTDDETGRYRDFLCQLCIQALESKYKLTLDKRYKLPKLKAMGDLQQQYIQDRKRAPKIEEISETTAAKKPSGNKKQAAAAAAMSAPIVRADIPLSTFAVSWYQLPTNGLEAFKGDISAADPADVVQEFSTAEYVEPMARIPAGKDAVRVVADISECLNNAYSNIDVQLSAYKIKIKVPGYSTLTINFPCALLPATVSSKLCRPPGSVRRVCLCVVVGADARDVDTENVGMDPGSKQWLVARALDSSAGDDVNTGSGGGNPYRDNYGTVGQTNEQTAAVTAAVADDDDDTLPEDKFHVRLPKNVDKYTGLPINDGSSGSAGGSDGPVAENEELPEDRFHKKDAQSSYIIEQREQQIKEKFDRAAK